ncbi:MAG TPA: hypothetical protein EYP33_03535 [Pyrodictium sp.]|nr:hypothetical protein [Pyrodictium sp.]
MESIILEIIKNPLYVLSFLLIYLVIKVEKVVYRNTIAIQRLEEYIKTKDNIIVEEIKEIKEVLKWLKEKYLMK